MYSLCWELEVYVYHVYEYSVYQVQMFLHAHAVHSKCSC